MAWNLTLQNDIGRAITPYPVVTTPPPPHRVADPSNAIGVGASGTVDVAGFNPVYIYPPLPQIAGQPNGFIVQLDLESPDPTILVISYQYKVPPGEEQGDPANQPVAIAQFPFTGLEEGSYELVAGEGMLDFALNKASSSSNGGGCLILPFYLLAGGWLLR